VSALHMRVVVKALDHTDKDEGKSLETNITLSSLCHHIQIHIKPEM